MKPITFALLLISLASFTYKLSGGKRENNVHNWIIYYNDSEVVNTMKKDHGTDFLTLAVSKIKSTDSLKIRYYNDYMCGNIPLISIKDGKQNRLLRYEEKSAMPVSDLLKLKSEKGITAFEFHYTDKCPDEKNWDAESLTRSLLNITLKE